MSLYAVIMGSRVSTPAAPSAYVLTSSSGSSEASARRKAARMRACFLRTRDESILSEVSHLRSSSRHECAAVHSTRWCVSSRSNTWFSQSRHTVFSLPSAPSSSELSSPSPANVHTPSSPSFPSPPPPASSSSLSLSSLSLSSPSASAPSSAPPSSPTSPPSSPSSPPSSSPSAKPSRVWPWSLGSPSLSSSRESVGDGHARSLPPPRRAEPMVFLFSFLPSCSSALVSAERSCRAWAAGRLTHPAVAHREEHVHPLPTPPLVPTPPPHTAPRPYTAPQ